MNPKNGLKYNYPKGEEAHKILRSVGDGLKAFSDTRKALLKPQPAIIEVRDAISTIRHHSITVELLQNSTIDPHFISTVTDSQIKAYLNEVNPIVLDAVQGFGINETKRFQNSIQKLPELAIAHLGVKNLDAQLFSNDVAHAVANLNFATQRMAQCGKVTLYGSGNSFPVKCMEKEFLLEIQKLFREYKTVETHRCNLLVKNIDYSGHDNWKFILDSKTISASFGDSDFYQAFYDGLIDIPKGTTFDVSLEAEKYLAVDGSLTTTYKIKRLHLAKNASGKAIWRGKTNPLKNA